MPCLPRFDLLYFVRVCQGVGGGGGAGEDVCVVGKKRVVTEIDKKKTSKKTKRIEICAYVVLSFVCLQSPCSCGSVWGSGGTVSL